MNNHLKIALFISLGPLALSAQSAITAVHFGGNYGGNSNSPIPGSQHIFIDSGDFNNNGSATDTRQILPIDSSPYFIQLAALEGRNNRIHAGAQIVNFDDAANPGFQLFRYNGSANSLQVSNAAGTSSMGIVFAPHVRKADFLNGADSMTSLTFANQEAGFTGDFSFSGGATGDGIRRARLLVQAGDDWYISQSTVGGATSALSLNPYTELWYPYNADTNLLYWEATADIPEGSSLAGSLLEDIQAIGVVLMNSQFDGSSVNAVQLQTTGFSAVLIPEPRVYALLMGLAALALIRFTKRR